MKLSFIYYCIVASMAGSTSKMASASSLQRKLNKGKGGKQGMKGLKHMVKELEAKVDDLTNKLREKMMSSKTIIDYDVQLYGDEYCDHLARTVGPIESCNSVCPLVLRVTTNDVGLLPPIIGNCNALNVCVPACTDEDGTICGGLVEDRNAVEIAKSSVCESKQPTGSCSNDVMTLSPGESVLGTNIGGPMYTYTGAVYSCDDGGQGYSPLSPASWYQVVGEEGKLFTASTCSEATDFDTVVSVFTSCEVNTFGTYQSCIAINDDDCGLQSSVTWPTTEGKTYFIMVQGVGAYGHVSETNQGTFELSLSAEKAPTQSPTSSAGPTQSPTENCFKRGDKCSGKNQCCPGLTCDRADGPMCGECRLPGVKK